LNLLRVLFLLPLVLFTMVTHSGWSQKEFIIKGKVVNETGTPIKNAAVQVDIHNARTNSEGYFIIKNGKFPTQITVKGNSYTDFTDIVLSPEKGKDTVNLTIVMTAKETQLDEVTIHTNNKFWVYPKKQANILDFILQPNDGIVLCCSDKNNYFIRGLNPQGEKIAEASIRRSPQKLFRDCMENIHLVYSDSIYQTSIINNSLGFFQPKPAPGIFDILQSCVYMDEKSLLRCNYSKQNQCIEYLAITIKTKEIKTMYLSEDPLRNKQLEQYDEENRLDDRELMTSNLRDLGIARRKWDNRCFYEQVLTQPIYVPLFELNDSLIIFDHLKDSAVVFTKSGQRIRSFPIYYHYFKGWKNELVSNLEKTEIYARYESEGLTVLREINPTNGKTERLIRIEEHVFPQHLQIHGDFIYYISNDYLDKSMHYLFKQHLTNR
jgi:hypothetical protein